VRDTREDVFLAAAELFSARGFDGVGVDDIAHVARLNKAMIYYHFAGKADLYREILRDMFAAVGARARAVAASAATPDDKIRRFVAAIADEADARPHFPPIWFREIAEGGAHLDAETLGHVAAVVAALRAIIDAGVQAGRFKPANPFLVHAGIVGPLLLFFASRTLRARLQKVGVPAATIQRDDAVRHVQGVAIATLEGRTS
jgi:TetR/AcrR family transcriptional regulator